MTQGPQIVADSSRVNRPNIVSAAVLGMGWGIVGAYALGLAAAILLGVGVVVTGYKSIRDVWPLVVVVPILMVLPALMGGICAGVAAGAAASFVRQASSRTVVGFVAGALLPWLTAVVLLHTLWVPAWVVSSLIAPTFYCAGIGAIVGRIGQREFGEPA